MFSRTGNDAGGLARFAVAQDFRCRSQPAWGRARQIWSGFAIQFLLRCAVAVLLGTTFTTRVDGQFANAFSDNPVDICHNLAALNDNAC
jgi:hypothetical protein